MKLSIVECGPVLKTITPTFCALNHPGPPWSYPEKSGDNRPTRFRVFSGQTVRQTKRQTYTCTDIYRLATMPAQSGITQAAAYTPFVHHSTLGPSFRARVYDCYDY